MLEAIEAKSPSAQRVWSHYCPCRTEFNSPIAFAYAFGGWSWWVTPKRRERLAETAAWVTMEPEARRLDDPEEEWPQIVVCSRCQKGYLYADILPGGAGYLPGEGYVVASYTLDPDRVGRWQVDEGVMTYDLKNAEPPKPSGVGGLVVMALGKPVVGRVAP